MKAGSILLLGAGAGFILLHMKNNAAVTVPGTLPAAKNTGDTASPVDTNTTTSANPTPKQVLNLSDLPGDDFYQGYTDLSNIPGYAQCVLYIDRDKSNDPIIYRSGWSMLSNVVNAGGGEEVSTAQLLLYNAGHTPDTIYAAQQANTALWNSNHSPANYAICYSAKVDAFSILAAMLNEDQNPKPPASNFVNIDWSNPPVDVVAYLAWQLTTPADLQTLSNANLFNGLL